MLHERDDTGNTLDQVDDRTRLEFGAELRQCRKAAGLSLADLALRVHYSKSHLSKIENGRNSAGTDLARQCDAALGTGGRLAALAERSARPAPLPIGDRGPEVWVMSVAGDGGGWAMPMSRRDALRTGVSSMVGLQFVPRAAGAAALAPALASFRELFDQSRRLGQLTGPAVVLPMVVAQTQAVRGMAAQSAGAPEHAGFLRLAARYAEFTGWMAQEAGHDRVALGWTRTAVEIAAAAGDRELGAHALVRQALITLYRDDAVQTVHLARLARAEPGVSQRVRGLAALREAQGHALAGDHDACLRALDEGRELLSAVAPEPVVGPVLGPTSLPDMSSVVTGWCLHDLGRPEQAVDVLAEELRRIPAAARRARARYGTRLALSYLGAGEVGEACVLLDGLLDEVAVVDSATVRTDLRRFVRALPRWRTHPHARDLQERLADVVRVPMS